MVIGNKAVTAGEMVIVTKKDGTSKNVIECQIDTGLYKSEAEAAGFDFDTVTKVNKFNGTYIRKVTEEAVIAGTQMLLDNKEADRVEFIAPYINDDVTQRTSKMAIGIDREKAVTIPGKGVVHRPGYDVNINNKLEAFENSFAVTLKEVTAKLAAPVVEAE